MWVRSPLALFPERDQQAEADTSSANIVRAAESGQAAPSVSVRLSVAAEASSNSGEARPGRGENKFWHLVLTARGVENFVGADREESG